MRYWIDKDGKEHRDNDMPTLDLMQEVKPKYSIADFKGLRVIPNENLMPHEIVVVVGVEVWNQLKAEAADAAGVEE